MDVIKTIKAILETGEALVYDEGPGLLAHIGGDARIYEKDGVFAFFYRPTGESEATRRFVFRNIEVRGGVVLFLEGHGISELDEVAHLSTPNEYAEPEETRARYVRPEGIFPFEFDEEPPGNRIL